MIPWTIACQAPLSMEFSRQEYWTGLPFPTPGDLPNPGTKPTYLVCPALASGFFTTWEASKSPSVQFSRSVVYDSLQPHGLQPTRLLCPRNFPGKNTGVGCHFLLQGIFPTQRSNPHLLSSAFPSRFFTTAPAGKP